MGRTMDLTTILKFTCTLVVLCCVISRGKTASIINISYVTNSKDCTFVLWQNSKAYFQSRMIDVNPKFARFKLRFYNMTSLTNRSRVSTSATTQAFLPNVWVWTYRSPTEKYPYLSWDIDFGILSFGLLDSQSFDITHVNIDVTGTCHINLGSANTTRKIAETLSGLVANLSDHGFEKHDENLFCYMEETPGIRNTFQYKAGLYLNYPVNFINYKCCNLKFSYEHGNYTLNCSSEQPQKWTQCTQGPYILGLVIFMFFPILLFQLCAWLSKNEHVVELNDDGLLQISVNQMEDEKDEWIFLGANAPLTLSDVFCSVFIRFRRRNPTLVSRIRRLLGIVLAPALIYLQITMYKKGIGHAIKIHVEDLVKQGTPVGFLSILANTHDASKVLAPLLGGPLYLLITYYILGIIFLVFPKSLKQIVERGISRGSTVSPMFLGAEDIIKCSMLKVTPEPGHEKASLVCKCSIYMLFSKLFWVRAIEMQQSRFRFASDKQQGCTVFRGILYLLYHLVCILELLMCVIFYAIPVFRLIHIMVRGAVKSILIFRLQNRVVSMIFRNPFMILLGCVTVFCMFIFYSYIICLVFIESFSFVAQIIIYCFIAILMFPATSFGYLFFFIVLIYYLVRLVKAFGDGYQELLQVAVEKSCELYNQTNYMTLCDGQLLICNIQLPRLRGIRINETLLDIPANVLQSMTKSSKPKKVTEEDNMFGIPRELFENLVREFRPVHINVMKLFFQFFCIIFLVAVTILFSSKFQTEASSEISDVMHIIFLITVGALPRVLEVAMSTSSEAVNREVEMRRIEQFIKEYWMTKADERSSGCDLNGRLPAVSELNNLP